MITYALIFTAGVVVGAMALLIAALCTAAHIANGEADTNSAPERDGGQII